MKSPLTEPPAEESKTPRPGCAAPTRERGYPAAAPSGLASGKKTRPAQPCASRSRRKPAPRSPFSRFYYFFDV